jgi:hypothetical protein
MTGNLARDLFASLAEVDRDPFGLPPLAGPVPDEVLAGLAKLATAPPLWGDRLEWTELVASLQAFSARWHCPATAAGWSLLQLYGLDPVAPRSRLSRMGGAFLASLRAHRVVSVDANAITMVTRTSARLRIYRGEIDDGAVLAWSLCQPQTPNACASRRVWAAALRGR